ncbi:hypothetical protein PFMALIP_02412 [Plasmodium falciparum MaliPS096_E11]|uniref:Uncharacterized protein n=1 Tax=Plasmodium falciparum MaliPS096_E11 TaxID=1036727 RepID=A0A024WQI3_PLAFA|nr:hypothetical protein PFMALIP_02412 [Plasmodium falciparum MaliPS096_E11]
MLYFIISIFSLCNLYIYIIIFFQIGENKNYTTCSFLYILLCNHKLSLQIFFFFFFLASY